jgi:hypothetical protein
MNTEVLGIAAQLRDSYEGDPWWGRNANKLLGEVDEQMAFEKLNGQHSILELVWHNDWRHLNHTQKSLWHQGIERLHYVHDELITIVEQQTDELLDKQVAERDYNFRKLFHGVLQHDVYHLGQIAYIVKMLRKQ